MDIKHKKWVRPSEKSIRHMAAALGIPGHERRDVADLYQSINNHLLGSFYGHKPPARK